MRDDALEAISRAENVGDSATSTGLDAYWLMRAIACALLEVADQIAALRDELKAGGVTASV